MSHNSDLPLQWKVQVRRAVNQKANALAGFASEAGELVRKQVTDLVLELQLQRGCLDEETLIGVIESITFEDLFQRRPIQEAADELQGRASRARQILADIAAREAPPLRQAVAGKKGIPT